MQRLVGPLTVALLGFACLIGAIAFAVEWKPQPDREAM